MQIKRYVAGKLYGNVLITTSRMALAPVRDFKNNVSYLADFFAAGFPNNPSAHPPTFAPNEVPIPGPISTVPTAAPAIVPPVG